MNITKEKNANEKTAKQYEEPKITIYPIGEIRLMAASSSPSDETKGPTTSTEEESASGGRAKENDFSQEMWDNTWSDETETWSF